MTAFDALNKCVPEFNGVWSEADVQKTVCDALERMIPKHPKSVIMHCCPECGHALKDDDFSIGTAFPNFCMHCGQSIDWSYEDDD